MTHIWTAGACHDNPGGPMGIGVVIEHDHDRIELSEGIGNGTINIAHYRAVIRGLEYARDHGFTEIAVSTDAQLVPHQVDGTWSCDHETLIALRDRVRELLAHTGASLAWIRGQHNATAERLARAAIVQVRMTPTTRDAIRELLQNDLFTPPIAPAIRAVLELAVAADDLSVAEALRALRCGRDAYSSMDIERVRECIALRHGAAAVEEIERALARRSDKSRLAAMRWCGRGLPSQLALARINIERSQRKPFIRQFV